MRSRLTRGAQYTLGVVIALFSAAHVVMATPPGAVASPEIDGASIASGLGLLASAVMILKSRWK
jgi:hypothetical protein